MRISLTYFNIEVFMGLRKIITDDLELLHRKSRKVTEFNFRLNFLLDDMVETLKSKDNAVGLAAPQIGIFRCVVVIDVGDGVLELINPEIVEKKGEQTCLEGCLSFPNRFENVKRPSFVRVKALNRNAKEFFVEGCDLLARVLCHEIDHLNGIVFLDVAQKMLEE